MDGTILVLKDVPEAVTPTKAHPTDSGYDITVISVYKTLANGVTLYNTGLRLAPTKGIYVDLVGRSSLMKQGYMLANNIGIIDNSYRGPLIVALLKFEEDTPELTLPARVAQIIPRRVLDINMVETYDLSETERGEGGFGSTGQ